jgi:type IV pilus assembly protein PilW
VFAPCAAVTSTMRAGTEVLAIKRVAGTPTASTFIDVNDVDGDGDSGETLTVGAGDLQAGTVYLRTNGISATIIDDAAAGNAPAVDFADWVYRPTLWFVRSYHETVGDGVPALCRTGLAGATLNAVDCLVQGIEDIHVQFGVDTDGDGVVNLYTSAPTLAQLDSVVTARVYVLARSVDPDPYHTDTKQYLLGDVVIAAANDGYYRNVYSTTVTVRNTKNRILFQ